MFDFEPVTEINGWKGHQTALDLSTTPEVREAHILGYSPMSRVGDGAAFSACNFAESGSSRRDHLRRRNRMWGRSDIGQIRPSS